MKRIFLIYDCNIFLTGRTLFLGQTGSSGPQHLLHHVAGHVVQEKSQDGEQQESRDDLDGQPPVLVTHQVLRHLERDEEPEEGNVRAAGGAQTDSMLDIWTFKKKKKKKERSRERM